MRIPILKLEKIAEKADQDGLTFEDLKMIEDLVNNPTSVSERLTDHVLRAMNVYPETVSGEVARELRYFVMLEKTPAGSTDPDCLKVCTGVPDLHAKSMIHSINMRVWFPDCGYSLVEYLIETECGPHSDRIEGSMSEGLDYLIAVAPVRQQIPGLNRQALVGHVCKTLLQTDQGLASLTVEVPSIVSGSSEEVAVILEKYLKGQFDAGKLIDPRAMDGYELIRATNAVRFSLTQFHDLLGEPLTLAAMHRLFVSADVVRGGNPSIVIFEDDKVAPVESGFGERLERAIRDISGSNRVLSASTTTVTAGGRDISMRGRPLVNSHTNHLIVDG
jgi:hypothetical protein